MRRKDKLKQDSYLCKRICDMLERYEFRTDHPSQRRVVWGTEYRDNFIVTVLLNEDFDPIKICEQIINGNTVNWIIDGKQRCTTLVEFRAGKFALGKKLDPSIITYDEVKKDENGMILKDEDGNPLYDEIEYDLRGKSYNDLPEALKDDFNNCTVKYTKHLDCTDKELMRHMIRYNNCAEMRPNQKIMVKIGNIVKEVRKLSEHPFWLDCTSLGKAAFTNGTLERNVSELLMGINFWSNWTKDANRMSKFLNDNATKDMCYSLENELNELMNIVENNHKEKFTSKSAIIWFKFFDECKKKGITGEVYGKFLDSFEQYETIPVQVMGEYNNPDHSKDEKVNIINYHDLEKDRSTKDRGIIEDKLHILHTLMDKFLRDNGIKIESTTEELEEVVENNKEEVTELLEENTVDEIENYVESENYIDKVENITVDASNEVEPVESKMNGEILESTDNDNEVSDEDKEILSFVKENTDMKDVQIEDIEDYENLVIRSMPNNGQNELIEQCFPALVALAAYAYQTETDCELEEWLKKYNYSDNHYSSSQRTNYLFLKRDFDKACVGIA